MSIVEQNAVNKLWLKMEEWQAFRAFYELKYSENKNR